MPPIQAAPFSHMPLLVRGYAQLGDPERALDDRVITAATAVELTHLASLYHDDVMDSAPTRRGVPSAQHLWGNNRAILAGDILFARASLLVASLGPEIVEHVKFLILTGGDVLGSTVPKICTAVMNADGYDDKTLPILFIDDFEAAVQAAADHAQSGDVVLLSPASTSFDKFANFMERGKKFKNIVNHMG